MSESIVLPLQVHAVQVHAVLHCRSTGAPVLHSEAAARWTLRHVAFNSGFEQHPAASGRWAPPLHRPGVPGFELSLAIGDGRFVLRVRPAQRRLELRIVLGQRAGHLRRNLPRLVDEFAVACLAEVLSFEIVDDGKGSFPMGDGSEDERLVLPA